MLDTIQRPLLKSAGLDFNYLFDYSFPEVRIGGSRVEGFGLFSGQKIEKGKIVLPILGLLYRISKSKINYPKYSFPVNDDIALEPANEAGFLNHSCEPNLYVNDDWVLVALRDISSDEELTIDYGTADYFDYGFECACKSAGCRKNYHGKICEDKSFRKANKSIFTPYLKGKFGIKPAGNGI